MELVLTILGSAAIGSLLGLLVKEGIDYLRSEKAHRNEMQRRYFDAKLDATLRAIQQMKSNTSALKAVLNVLRQNEEMGGWIHPELLNTSFQGMTQTLQRINEQAAGVIALLGFYYDDSMVRLAEGGSSPPVPLLQKMSELIARIGNVVQVRLLLASTPDAPADIRSAVEKQADEQDAEIRIVIGELSKIANSLDELSDEVIRRMRAAYEGIRL
jgi:DNA-binding transcriptional MerR regulator